MRAAEDNATRSRVARPGVSDHGRVVRVIDRRGVQREMSSLSPIRATSLSPGSIPLE